MKNRPTPDDARRELRAWLDEHGETCSWLAGLLGVTPATVSRWFTTMTPTMYRDPIEELTGGRVMATWWRSPDEWDLLARARKARGGLEAPRERRQGIASAAKAA